MGFQHSYLHPRAGGGPPVNNFGCFQQGHWVCGWLRWFRFPFPLGVGLTLVACGGFVWSFVRLLALVLVLVVCVLRAGGFVCLSLFGPRWALGLVAPRGVGFSLSRFGLVLVVCAVVSFYYSLSPFGAWYWSPQAITLSKPPRRCENGKIRYVNYSRLSSAPRKPAVESGRSAGRSFWKGRNRPPL